MNILCTGAAGFIGSNFVKYLLGNYGDVGITVLDKLTYAGNLKTIGAEIESGAVDFVRGDICEAGIVDSIFESKNIDVVVNFAAESHVDRSIEDPNLFLVTNILGTQNLLECAKRHWSDGEGSFCSGKKFVQVSTDEVYGSLSKDYAQPVELAVGAEVENIIKGRKDIYAYGKEFFTEKTNLCPHSPYSASKASADMIVMAYHDTYGLPVNITRCSNNYGAYQFPEKLIPLIIKNILEGRKLPVYGKGENVLDWIYLEDHAKAIYAVMRRGRDGEVYNIGGFNEETNINIVRLIIDTIRSVMDHSPEYRRVLKTDISNINYDLISYVADRPGHDMRYAIDPSKIASELGWYPETGFAEGILKTVLWYLDNQSWVEDVVSG